MAAIPGITHQRAAFSDIYAARSLQVRINGRTTFAELVSGDYFGMLGVGAELGRTFVPDDAAAPGHAPVMVLSNAGWRKLFAGDSCFWPASPRA